MSSYQSDAEIEEEVRAFETCETGKDDFKHRDHLVVAVWYVQTLGREAALDRMRAGLLRFLEHHGVDKKIYSEAITVFWIDKITKKLNELGPDVSLVEKCKTVLAADFADERRLTS